MEREQLIAMFKRVPEADIPKVVLVLQAGQGVNVDMMYKYESDYLVVRGRELGSNDEGRAFFLPYEQISYMKIERVVKLEELDAMYGKREETSSGTEAKKEEGGAVADKIVSTPGPVGVRGPAMDPAAIARQNLLDRIRAARTSSGMASKK